MSSVKAGILHMTTNEAARPQLSRICVSALTRRTLTLGRVLHLMLKHKETDVDSNTVFGDLSCTLQNLTHRVVDEQKIQVSTLQASMQDDILMLNMHSCIEMPTSVTLVSSDAWMTTAIAIS